VRAEHVTQAGGQVALDGIPQAGLRLALPAVRGKAGGAAFVEAHVEGQHDPLRPELVDPGRDFVGLRDRNAADDDACHAQREQFLGHLARADPAAGLDGIAAGTVRDLAYRPAVTLRTVACTVEVDNVDPPGPERQILPEHRERILRIDGLGIEAPLQQAHALAAPQVDGRNEQHQPSSRKLASTRAPGCAERSGWNCTPWKLPWCTA